MSYNPELRGKQRRFLRAMATGIDPILHIGKYGINENLVSQIDSALEARELVKIKVLQNVSDQVEQIGREIAANAEAELIQVIGRNVVLFRRSKSKPRIELP